MTLRAAAPAEAGFRPDGLQEVDRVVEAAVSAHAFPGAVLAVGKDGVLAHLQPFGHLSYDADAASVRADTMYDLASLTKVIVTTTMAMILVDEGKLDINKPVSAFLPEFHGGSKDKVTVWHLLTHSSGVDWWAPLYKDLKGKDAYLKRVLAMDLVYEPGAKSVYSDLGVLLLGEILERVAGQDINSFARARLFEPLGMKDTTYLPGPELLPRIAPTENDPWRGHVLRGEVHDENAAALGGIAPHAGLFGTASDLARFAQMLLNGGVFEQKRIVSRETIERFTKRQGVPDSSRALGWDTPSENSSAGSLFGPRSFGHTGFTGTSMWMDPDRHLFVILLTNRVHPTRENNAIREVRRAVADAVVRGLAQP
jgi:CubicO group peptidase (beta-lactamase class C family)